MSSRWVPPLRPMDAKGQRELSIARLVESLPNYPQRELTHDFVYAMIVGAYDQGRIDGRNAGQQELLEQLK